MAKQQFTFTLSTFQVEAALREYAGRMVDVSMYDIAIVPATGGTGVQIVATKRRIRKPKPKVLKAA